MSGFYGWSEAHLGQWHYILGYAITLLHHKWPLMLALGGGAWFGARAYARPDRRSVSWLLAALLLGLAYEYDKHIAQELHHAVDFLFLGELAGLNRPMHLLVGTALRAALALGCLAMLARSVWLSAAARRAAPDTEQPANPGARGA